VETLAPTVSVNFWTDSVYLDSWSYLTDQEKWNRLLPVVGASASTENFVQRARLVVSTLVTLVAAALPGGTSGSDSSGRLSTVAKQLLRQRYGVDSETGASATWDSRTKAFRDPDVIRRRAAVAKGCQTHKTHESPTSPSVDAATLAEIQDFADVFNALDAGARDLLMAEWIDEFSGWALGDAASARGLKIGVGCVGTFWESCLAG
jgi:hypothetical protein